MLTGPTVAPIGDLTDSAGPTAGTISVALEEMPGIADGLDAVSRNCADRTMPVLGIAAETRLFLGINGHAQQAAGLCAGLAADLGISAAKFGATAAAVRAAHSSYLQTENIVAGWFESMGIAKDGKLPDGRSTRDHLRGLIAGEPGEADYLIKLTFPELGYFAASRTLPYSPLVAGILFGFTAYMDATWNPEIARSRAFDRLAGMFGIPRGFARKAIRLGVFRVSGISLIKATGYKAYNVRTTSADEYGITTHRGEKSQLSVGSSSERLQAAAKAQDQEFERSQQDPTKGERGAVMVTVMYEAGHEGDPAHALYVVSIPGTNFNSWGGSPMDPAGAVRETLGTDTTRNSAYQMVLQALRDAGAPQGARVYMEGFSQGAMIAYNMANSLEVAKEINIVGIYAQGTPLRGLPAKRRSFSVDYVEGEGDIVPDSAWREGGWRPDDRDTAITVQNPVHHGEKYREAVERAGYSNAVFGGMRAAMDGKDYVLGEQKVTSGSAMPDGYSSVERSGVTTERLGFYLAEAYKSGVKIDEKGIDEAIIQGTGGKVRGLQDAKNKMEKIKQGAKDAWEAGKPRLPQPEPKPPWSETPVPQMPNLGSLPAPNLAPAQPVLSAANTKLLGSNTEALANRGFIVNAPQDTQPVSRMPMAPAEDIDPGFIVRPEAQPTLGSVAPRLIHGLPDAVKSLPRIGDLITATPHMVGANKQGGDYDGGESLIPALPDLKPAPMPMTPAEDIDPGFRTPIPPEVIDPGLVHPAPEPRHVIAAERELVFA